VRPIEELVNVDEPAWPELLAELEAAPVPIEILPIDGDAGREALYRLQVTARSRLGAMALHTGGLLVEGGWLRVLGGGHPARGLPGLAEANGPRRWPERRSAVHPGRLRRARRPVRAERRRSGGDRPPR
jgi:hypothetical protein